MTAEDPPVKYPGPFPAVVKPAKMENSVGVEIVEDYDQMQGALERAWQYGDTAVVDQFIAGREVRCGSVELVPGVVSPLGCIEYKVSCSQHRCSFIKLLELCHTVLSLKLHQIAFLLNRLQHVQQTATAEPPSRVWTQSVCFRLTTTNCAPMVTN